jgi:hypothetical protein
MSTWLVHGYRCPLEYLTVNEAGPPFLSAPKRKVPEGWVIVDGDEDSDEDTAFDAAYRIAGSEYFFLEKEPLLTGAIPFACRNVLFTSEKELYARVPDLDEAFPPDDDERSAP